MLNLEKIEIDRIHLQSLIDKGQSKLERNIQGQFSTPLQLAIDISEKTLSYFTKPIDQIRFLEPAIGLGVFYSAILFRTSGIEPLTATGIEIDTKIVKMSRTLWKDSKLEILNSDFLKSNPPINKNDKYDLLITNPPYVRHHHIKKDEKEFLSSFINDNLNIKVNGLMGLYGYFILIAHLWMKQDGVESWLVPREFMDVKYGRSLRKYLTEYVTLLQIHCFEIEDVQFKTAEVTSTIIIFKMSPPKPDNKILFTKGSNIKNPNFIREIDINLLKQSEKWSTIIDSENPTDIENIPKGTLKLGDFFKVKRGVATGANDYFIIDEKIINIYNIPKEFLIPTLPAPRYLTSNIINKKDVEDEHNNKLYILNCKLNKSEIETKYHGLYEYIQLGEKKEVDKVYLTRNKKPWYLIEQREPAPILCAYSGRKSKKGDSIRFIRNKSNVVVTNSYYNLYPKKWIKEKDLQTQEKLYDDIFNVLIKIDQKEILKHGRSYGGGFRKIEPKELENVVLPFVIINQGLDEHFSS